MPTWIVVPLVAVAAIVVLALVWWSSGRARPRGRGPATSITDKQAEEISASIAKHTPNRTTFG